MIAPHDASTKKCWFAILTPTNRGAIAVLRVWGPDALGVADALFRPSRGPGLAATTPGRLRLGRVGEGLGDEVVGVVLKAENHLFPECSVEFQCHGGPAAWELLARGFESAGAARANQDDWIRYSYESPVRAAAWSDLTRAKTARVAEILLDQAQGAFGREVRKIIGLLRNPPIEDPTSASSAIEVLLGRSQVGLRLIPGWRIVLAGRPNVGKSSLLNALAGYKRSIVDAAPGTTRDIITLPLAIDGWPVELSDTAGLRQASETLERIGIDRAIQAHRQADLILPIVDRSEALTPTDLDLIRTYAMGKLPIVANKADLPPAWSPQAFEGELGRIIEVSTRDGTGMDALISAIGSGLVEEVIGPGAGVPFRPEHVDRLHEARLALSRGDRLEAVETLGLLL